MSKNPIAVLISDIHFNLKTLEVASEALSQAVIRSNWLGIPLILTGDTHDSKANIRGECINAINDILLKSTELIYLLVGNHDLINERGNENALGFIKKGLVITSTFVPHSLLKNLRNLVFIPYQTDSNQFIEEINRHADDSIFLVHQGLISSNMGDYIQDKSAVTKEAVAGKRIISGHYHTRQSIDLLDGGKWDYVGNPYTLTYGEAKDPEKGYQILYDDGSLEFVPTNLRKHVVIEMDGTKSIPYNYKQGDLVWVKLRAKREDLKCYTKDTVAKMLNIHWGFKLDLIPDQVQTTKQETKNLTSEQIYDNIIETSSLELNTKVRLKDMWKQYVNKA